MARLIELFEGDDRRLSMTRLLMFMAFFPSSWVLIENGDEGMMGWYLGAFVLGYVGGKAADKYGQKKDMTMVNKTESGDINASPTT